MKVFNYNLDKSARKFSCPNCGKKTLVKFKDLEGNYLSDKYGRCDRENNCAYFYAPWMDEEIKLEVLTVNRPVIQTYIPQNTLEELLSNYSQNNFLNSLQSLGFNTDQIITDYYLGTIGTGSYKGAISFPFITHDGLVTAIQIKQFNAKLKTTGQNWIHSIIEKENQRAQIDNPTWLKYYLKNEKLVRCLFGSHLIKRYPTKKIIVTESPKNAIIGALFNPDFLWLSTLNFSMIKNQNIFKCLTGREVILMPDNAKDDAAFTEWDYQANRMRRDLGLNVMCSSFLLNKCTDEQKEEGFDIADYYLQNFIKQA